MLDDARQEVGMPSLRVDIVQFGRDDDRFGALGDQRRLQRVDFVGEYVGRDRHAVDCATAYRPSLIPKLNSLILIIDSLIGQHKFPVPCLRQFACNPLQGGGFFRSRRRQSAPKSRNSL